MVVGIFSKASKVLLNRNINSTANYIVRNSHAPWRYRSGQVKNPQIVEMSAEIVCGFAWWWILWHLFDEYDHIIGEFTYPDPRKWTDEELGIPTAEEMRLSVKK